MPGDAIELEKNISHQLSFNYSPGTRHRRIRRRPPDREYCSGKKLLMHHHLPCLPRPSQEAGGSSQVPFFEIVKLHYNLGYE
jgi:hypothetical protein